MTDKRDDQNFNDWFSSHFPDGQEKPATDAAPELVEPPQVPPQPVEPPHAPQQPLIPDYIAPQQPQQPQVDPQPPQFPPQPATTQYPQAPVPPQVDFGLAGQDAVPTEFIPSAAQLATDSNALDALFGEDKFQEYEDALVSAPPPPTTPATPEDAGDEPPKGISTMHVTMMWVAGSVVAALALVAFFLVGTKLPMLTGATPTDPSSAPPPIETERPVGPVEPGIYNWNELLGGECIEDFRGAWENEYTVVDCAVPHSAQLVTRAAVPVVAGTGGTYPGVSDLQGRMNLLCTDAAVIDYEVAKQYDDVQFEASFPPSAEEWDKGRRDYFCFVSLASCELIEGSLAAPPTFEEPATEEEATEGD